MIIGETKDVLFFLMAQLMTVLKIILKNFFTLKKINVLEKLSKEQEDLIPIIRDKWLNQFFKLGEIDKPRIEKGVNWLYAMCKLKSPTIFYCKSPIEAQLLGNILTANVRGTVSANVSANVRDSVSATVSANVSTNVSTTVWANVSDNAKATVRDNVWANVSDNVWDNVSDNVWATVRDNVEANVWDNVSATVRDNVESNVWDNVSATVSATVSANVSANVRANVSATIWDNVSTNVRGNVWANAKATVSDNVEANVWDNKLKYIDTCSYGDINDFGWVSFHDYFVSIGIVKDDKFNSFKDLISANYFSMIQLEKAVIIIENPIHVHYPKDCLHSTKEMAIKWADGYGFYSVNGRNVEANIFESVVNDKFSFEDFQKLDNEDVKAAIITIIKENNGNKGVLDFLGAELIDEQIIKHGKQPIYDFNRLDLLQSDNLDSIIISYKDYQETQRLYKTKETFSWANDSQGNTGVKLAWNEMTCPSTGQTYLIETCPTFNSVIESAKWLRPSIVPKDVPYIWQSAN